MRKHNVKTMFENATKNIGSDISIKDLHMKRVIKTRYIIVLTTISSKLYENYAFSDSSLSALLI